MVRRLLVCLTTLLVILLLVAPAVSQTVVKRMRLGNLVEGMAYVSSGPLAGHVVIIDGRQLIAFPAEARGQAQWRKLFDFSALGISTRPIGVGYIASERLLIFSGNVIGITPPTATFYLSDHLGRPHGTISFTWPADFVAGFPYVEGVTWVPLGATRYPGCLIFAAIQRVAPFERAFFVINRQGGFVAKIPAPPHPSGPDYDFFTTGLAYRNGHLLVGLIDNTLWELDLDGNILAGPLFFDDAWDIEGVAALGSGRIALTSVFNGKLIFLDSDLNRLPEERSFRIGFGLSASFAVAWNPNASQFLVHANGYEPTLDMPQITALAADLSSAHRVVDMLPYGGTYSRMDYLPDDNLIALSKLAPLPRAIRLFNSSGLVEEIEFPSAYRIGGLAYIRSTDEFAANNTYSPATIDILDRSGVVNRTFDLSAHIPATSGIVDIAHFQPTPTPGDGEFMVLVAGPYRLLQLDFSGNFITEYSTAPLDAPQLLSVKAITSGPYAGAWAGVELNNNELIIFTLP